MRHTSKKLLVLLIAMLVVFGMLAAIVFFHETVDMTKWLGVLLIMVGCALIMK